MKKKRVGTAKLGLVLNVENRSNGYILVKHVLGHGTSKGAGRRKHSEGKSAVRWAGA